MNVSRREVPSLLAGTPMAGAATYQVTVRRFTANGTSKAAYDDLVETT
jgi:hypothetical protein